MRLLLDTHAFLWWLNDDPKLRAEARAAISDDAATQSEDLVLVTHDSKIEPYGVAMLAT